MKFWLTALAVIVVAFALRAYRLDLRPMHGDEAVHAYKFGQLLEENYYRYDPHEFHGPTLNYFTLIPAWLLGEKTYASLTEYTLRIVPVVFGVLVVLLPLLLTDALSKPVALVAAALTAISPAFVFYSRYYIQEMLLVFFTFALILAGYRYIKGRKLIWALLTGLFAGLCYVTKETCVIAFGSMLFALLIISLIRHRRPLPVTGEVPKIKAGHLLAAVAVAALVSLLFFSSFFTNWRGIFDSLRAYTTYFNRAGRDGFHFHPWYYYLQLLFYSKPETGGPPWTEAFILIMSVIGIFLVVARYGLGKIDLCLLDFLVVYTLIMIGFYSAIPYKTPWCLLSFYQGLILLAAIGIISVLNLIKWKSARVIVAVFFLIVTMDLTLQAVLSSFACYTDTSNPYVYAQPTTDVFKITRRVEEVADACHEGRKMPVFVVCTESDYWPLPWYLRSFENLGWWDDVNQLPLPAPVVIASAELEAPLIAKLYQLAPPGKKNLYVPLFDGYTELRRDVELRGYVTKDLWDEYQRLSTAPSVQSANPNAPADPNR